MKMKLLIALLAASAATTFLIETNPVVAIRVPLNTTAPEGTIAWKCTYSAHGARRTVYADQLEEIRLGDIGFELAVKAVMNVYVHFSHLSPVMLLVSPAHASIPGPRRFYVFENPCTTREKVPDDGYF